MRLTEDALADARKLATGYMPSAQKRDGTLIWEQVPAAWTVVGQLTCTTLLNGVEALAGDALLLDPTRVPRTRFSFWVDAMGLQTDRVLRQVDDDGQILQYYYVDSRLLGTTREESFGKWKHSTTIFWLPPDVVRLLCRR
jgi:hypothetical protein